MHSYNSPHGAFGNLDFLAFKSCKHTWKSGRSGNLPSTREIDAVVQNITTSVRAITQNLVMNPTCGAGEWYHVAHLNMSDSTQQCPSVWREYNTSGVRACGRPEITQSSGSCVPPLLCYQWSVQPSVWESYRLSSWRYRCISIFSLND